MEKQSKGSDEEEVIDNLVTRKLTVRVGIGNEQVVTSMTTKYYNLILESNSMQGHIA